MNYPSFIVAIVLLLKSSFAAANFGDVYLQLSPRVNDYSNFCYGTNSICQAAVTLHGLCDAFSGQKDQTQYNQCLCGNGWVSTTQACAWCDTAYDPSKATNADILSSANIELCSSYSATIAPIPTSVLVAYSSHNATFTGTVPGATGFPAHLTASPGQSTSTIGTSVVTRTFNGGGSALQTTSASLTGTSTAAVEAATASAGKSSSDAVGMKESGGRALCLALVSGIAVMWL